MEIRKLSEVPVTGLPLYEMQKVYDVSGPFTDMSFSLITLLPGQRVPTEGTGCHDADEYSIFLEGEVYTESGDYTGVCGAGQATLIPKGEAHWSENRTDKPCRLVCVMIR